MLERTKWDLGPHYIEFEPPDIFHVHLLAPVKPQEGLETVRILNEEVIPHVGKVYVLMEMAPGAAALSSDTRKAVATVKPTWAAVAIVGGTTVSRAILNMTLRALTLLSGTQPPTRMFKMVEDAHAFFDEVRAAKSKAANG